MMRETASLLEKSEQAIARAEALLGDERYIEADRELFRAVRCAAQAVLQPDGIGSDGAPVESGRGAR